MWKTKKTTLTDANSKDATLISDLSGRSEGKGSDFVLDKQPIEAEGESMPMGKDGEPLFMEVSPERTHEYIFSDPDLDRETAKTFVDNKINEAKKAIEKLGAEEEKAKKNIGTNLAQFKQKMQGLKQKKADAEKAQEYWEAVKNMQERIEAKEAGEKARKQAEQGTIEIDAQLSETELDEFGRPLVLAKDGTTTFGIIDADSGLAEAPIRLSLGENKVDKDGNNHGYGLLHIEASHGSEIRAAGYNSIEEFVENVARNYTDIREGAIVANNQTYLLEVSDAHNNTLFIQLSKDGSYWNVNSAGIFRKKYSRRKPKVYTVPAVGGSTITDTPDVNSGHTKGETAPAGNSPKTSEGKDNISATEKQEEGGKSSEQKTSVDNSEAFAGLPDSSLQSMVRNNERELSKLPADSPKREALQRIVDSAKAELAKRGDVQKDVRGGEDEPGESEVSSKLGEAVTELAKDASLDVVTDIAEGERELGDMASGVERQSYVEEVSRKFDDELQQQIEGKLPQGHIYQLGTPGAILLSTGVPNLPIELNSARLMFKATNARHDYTLAEVKGLVDAIQNPIAVFAYGDKSKAQNIVLEISHNGKNFVVGLSITPMVKGQKLEVNSIRTVYPKDNAEWLNWISQGKALYLDKEKIQVLMTQQRMTLADVDYLNLDDVAKIIKDFENPKIKPAIIEQMMGWHGSPHDFDGFDFSHMGEGEGAQVHGWGGYITFKESSGQAYAHNGFGRIKYKGMPYNEMLKDSHLGAARSVVLEASVRGISVGDALESLRASGREAIERAKKDGDEAIIQARKSQLEALESLNEADFEDSGVNRNLYEVEVPDDTGDNYLYEGKTAPKKHRRRIADVVRGLAETELQREKHGPNWLPNGLETLANVIENSQYDAAEIRNRLVDAFGSERKASEILSKAGFVGIRYDGRVDGPCAVIFNEKDMKIKNHTQFFKTSAGEVYGFVKDGKIYLDPRLMNPNTPIHEYTHLWDKAVIKANPQLWARGKELMKQLPLWEEVKNDRAYADIAGDEDLLASEVHSRLSGKDGEKLLNEMVEAAKKRGSVDMAEAVTLKEQIKAWIKDFFGWVRDAFGGKWGAKDLASLTIEEFAAMPIKDLAKGVNPNEEVRKRKGETAEMSGVDANIEKMILGEKGARGLDEPGRVELNVVSSRDKASRDYIRGVMQKHGFSESETEELLGILDSVGDEVMRISAMYPEVREWEMVPTSRNGEGVAMVPKRSAFIKNGDYELNIDLGTLCVKREPLDAMMKILIDEGKGQNLGPSQLQALRDVLKKWGYLVQCDVCFVETKRARHMNFANDLAHNWNAICEAIGADGEFGKGRLSEEQRAILEAIAEGDMSHIDASKMRRYETKSNGERGDHLDFGLTKSGAERIAKLMLEDERMGGRMKAEGLMNTEDTERMLKDLSGTGFPAYLASFKGAATGKPMYGFRVYDPLSWREKYDEGYMTKATPEKRLAAVYGIGGVRNQSFTDFNPMLFFDYCQMYADLQARRLPLHTYTKVPALVELFGETGGMINMSLVPGVDPTLGSEFAGLKLKDGAQKGSRNPDDYDYLWVDESFPPEKAFELRQRPEYGGRVGTIAIGVSDMQIRKMLADERIDQVIPYHSSGMDAAVKVKTGLEHARDYESYQTTKVNGEGRDTWSFNEAMQRLGDPRKAAAEYLEMCRQKGYTPKFEMFVNEENYYKMLADFRCIDGEGNPVVQGPVRLKLPTNYADIWSKAMEERHGQSTAISEMMDNKGLMDDVHKVMAKQRLDGDIRDEMMRGLRRALGKNNVTSLAEREFFEALDKAYQAQGMSAEESREQVEVLRRGDGVVYGFAQGRKITLNENLFNANTPAHEFGHIWAKVVQSVRPELWSKGKDLLKQSRHWKEVMEDDLYRDIRDNEDAVASEVLSRELGGLNEEMVKELMQSGNARLAEKGVKAQILEWLREIWSAIRDTFSGEYKDLTFDEFINMPIRDLWDEAAGKQFKQRADKVFRKRKGETAEMSGVDANIEKMILGEKGARGLDEREREAGRKEAKRRMNELDVARKMETEGKEPLAIKQATGWERGADGMWRYEVPDGRFADGVKEDVGKGRTDWTLGEFWDDDALFEAYPELRDYRVVVDTDRELGVGTDAMFDGESKTITLTDDVLTNNNASTIAHEIQHAIQDIEGFAKGGNRGSKQEIYEHKMEEYLAAEDEYAKLLKPYSEYIEKIDAGLLPETDREWVESQMDANEALNAAREKMERLLAEAEGFEGVSSKKVYKNLAGEVEARNVQARMGMSAEERRNKLLEETEDVAREDQIFLRDNLGGSASMEENGESGNKKSQSKSRQDLTTRSEELFAPTSIGLAKKEKISKSLKHLTEKFKNRTSSHGVLTDLATAIGAKGNGASKYATFILSNGKEAEVRISNHNANAQTFAERGHTEGNISIVIKSRRSGNTFKAHEEVELTEYVYTTEAIAKDGNMLSGIAESLRKMIETGEYKDLTGKAIVNHSPEGDISFRTSEELDAEYPTWLSGQTTKSGQHTTQITSTKATYKKIGEHLLGEGVEPNKVSVLDASSGLGAGTEALREMGFDVEDVEPYPSEDREAPTYKRYEDIEKKYDVVISNAVLNVIPDDWRSDVLKSMADKLKVGGRLFINVRDAAGVSSQKQKIELDSPSEILVTDKNGNIRAYQKGFTKSELLEYVRNELGEGFDVEIANTKNSGMNNGTAVVVTRKSGEGLDYRSIESAKTSGELDLSTSEAKRGTVEKMSEAMHTPVKVVGSMEELRELEAYKRADAETQAEMERSKGWYDHRTGEMVLVEPNNHNVEDVAQTMLHETVAHRGLDELLGGAEKAQTFYDDVYAHLKSAERKRVNALMESSGWDTAKAMEEYMGKLAEKGFEDFDATDRSIWERFKMKVLKAIGDKKENPTLAVGFSYNDVFADERLGF